MHTETAEPSATLPIRGIMSRDAAFEAGMRRSPGQAAAIPDFTRNEVLPIRPYLRTASQTYNSSLFCNMSTAERCHRVQVPRVS